MFHKQLREAMLTQEIYLRKKMCFNGYYNRRCLLNLWFMIKMYVYIYIKQFLEFPLGLPIFHKISVLPISLLLSPWYLSPGIESLLLHACPREGTVSAPPWPFGLCSLQLFSMGVVSALSSLKTQSLSLFSRALVNEWWKIFYYSYECCNLHNLSWFSLPLGCKKV